jgi:hypothetical protein
VKVRTRLLRTLVPMTMIAGVGAMSVLAAGPAPGTTAPDQKKPSLTLRASPIISYSPTKITLVAELKGGPNDNEELYCPTVEWEWGDDTKSESSADCDPYVPGQSEIQRRFSVIHEIKAAGSYRIWIRLKKKDRTVIAANAVVQVNAGVHDPWEF